jgi:hypothetical protein
MLQIKLSYRTVNVVHGMYAVIVWCDITDGEYTTDVELREIFIDLHCGRLAEVKFISLQARFCRDLLAAMLQPEMNIREFAMNWNPWS